MTAGTVTSLADVVAPGRSTVRVRFPEEGAAGSTTLGSLWSAGEAVACLRADLGGAPVAAALTNSVACAAVLIGAVAAGQPLVSVPMPPRGADLDWYRGLVERICGATGAAGLVVDGALLPLVGDLGGLPLWSFEDVLAWRGWAASAPDRFVLTQFTSGSTTEPKGVVLPGARIAANVLALLDVLAPAPGDNVCTWLPLSHDMGLIGMFLSSLAGLGDRGAGGGELVVSTPQRFLRNPGSWLATCEESAATTTAAPNFGYDMAARRPGSVRDLRRLRTCIAGAEPIRPASLARFCRTFAGAGFDPTAMCPAYGMAEAALAVTLTPPATPWGVVAAPDAPGGPAAGPDGLQVVPCGSPLPGFGVRVDGDGVGEILVRGPSVADRYTDGRPVAGTDGWFRTRDLGFLHDGALCVVGRTDDVFQVAGRNVHALDVEVHAGAVPGVRHGRAVAGVVGEDLAVVAEADTGEEGPDAVSRIARTIRTQVASRVGVAPTRVLVVARGTLPLTSSGKVRRAALSAALRDDTLQPLRGSLS